jgi:phosphoglycolate phosphatase
MRAIAFDLDGTLIDPARGIIGSFQSALTALGREPPPFQELRRIIGPPLRVSFRQLLETDEEVEQALRLYRAQYGGGRMFEANVYDGVFPTLQRLRGQGRRLLLCTSKPQVFAVPILAHFGLAPLFDGVYGPELGGRFDDKGELFAHMLASENLAAAAVIMVGDRQFDMEAARRNRAERVGVLWGYGGAAELTLAGASALCANPRDLPDVLRGLEDAKAAAMGAGQSSVLG